MADPHADARAQVDALTAELVGVIDAAWTRIYDAEQRLILDWFRLSPTQRTARIRELQRLAADLTRTVEDRARGDIALMLQSAYTSGALQVATAVGTSADLLQGDKDLVRTISADTWLDVLNATRHVNTTTKEMVRNLGQEAASLRFSGLTTAVGAGEQLAKAMAGSGITAIVYRDGSRHGLSEYAGMLLRTKTAETYQVGGFTQAERLGVTFMELLDNPSCGLRSHDDPEKANGLILPLAEARKWPLSHPNCVRATTPRPDIRTAVEAAAGAPSTTSRQSIDQQVVEQHRSAAVASRASRRGGLATRVARNRAGLLTPSAGAAASAAARRNATIVARRAT